MRFVCLIFLIFYCKVGIYSQINEYNFKRLSNIQGLSQNWVRCIYQDDYGFMWFGTADGLNRYDGKEFKIYHPKTNNSIDIGEINVSSILKKNKNELWIGTDLGIYIYNYNTDQLYPFTQIKPKTVLSIIEDREKQIWIGTNNGLICYNTKSGTQILYINDPNNNTTLSNNYVNTLFEDTYSNIWVGTKGGLNVYLKNQHCFKQFKPGGLYSDYLTNDILSICEDHNGHMWIGYSQDGLYYFDNNADANIDIHKFYDGKIIALMVDQQNKLWVGKGSSEGLDRIDLNRFFQSNIRSIQQFRYNPLDNKSLSDNSIFSVYQDKLNDIWIGTFGEGINYYSERTKKFNVVKAGTIPYSINQNLVNAIIEDDNFVYIGTDGGLNIFDKKTNRFKLFKHHLNDINSISSDAVYAIHKDRKGNIWIGTWLGGISLFNPVNNSFKNFIADGKPGSLSSSNVFCILEDSRDNLWVGTIGGGLNRYDYKTGKFTCYKNDKNNASSLYYDLVNCIYETHDGKLFISVYNSLEQYDYENDNFIHYKHDFSDTLSNFGNIISIFEDSQNHIWLGTNSGLEYFNQKNKTFTVFTTQDGLPSNTIQAILEDDKGNLWISSSVGISKFISGCRLPKKPVFFNYTLDDGLSGNEFKKRSAFKNKSGIMYFGSSQGYTYFHPDSIRLNQMPPTAILSGFSILKTTPDLINKYEYLNQNINFTDKIELSYKFTDFIIKFSALNYLNPERNLFKYKLDGYDADWIDAGNQQSATYTNIDPGKYTFMVLASNNDGMWCKTPKKLSIIIHYPWWKTLFAKVIWIMLVILVIFLIYWLRFHYIEIQNIKLEKVITERTNDLVSMNTLLEQRQEEITIQNEELSEHRNNLEHLIEERTVELESAKKKAEESDLLKSAFLANMSHEIRTPMNAIVGFATLLKNRNIEDEQKNTFIETINKNCESLLVLIDDILDISLIESNQLKLSPEKFDVVSLLTELESYYLLRNNKPIDIQFTRTGQLYLDTDQVRFRQIFNNLLNNALKYTDGGKIQFGFKILDNEALFYVEDSGIGISKDNFNKIFSHFYKVESDTDKLYRGAGIGLSICKKLVEMMGGKIWVESRIKHGSTFYFTVPKSIITSSLSQKRIKGLDYKLEGIKIIVAEDESDNFHLIETILLPYKVNIFWAKNGIDAIDIVKNKCANNCIILMDIKMPIMDGITATREIKKMNSSIPVIAVTAYAQPGDKIKLSDEKFDDYISKPYKPEILLSAISRFVT